MTHQREAFVEKGRPGSDCMKYKPQQDEEAGEEGSRHKRTTQAEVLMCQRLCQYRELKVVHNY